MTTERLTKLSTVRLKPSQEAKAQRIAGALGISRNRVFGLLIEAAQEPMPRPALVVGEIKANSRNAQNFQAQGAAAVGA